MTDPGPAEARRANDAEIIVGMSKAGRDNHCHASRGDGECIWRACPAHGDRLFNWCPHTQWYEYTEWD